MIREHLVTVCFLTAMLAAAGPWAQSPESALAESGKRTYQMYCIVCHGQSGQGSPVGRSLISLDAKYRSDAQLLDTIANGVPGTAMAAYSKGLTEDEMLGVVAYVRELQGGQRGDDAREAVERPDKPALSREARAGEVLFNGEAGCIQCHSYRGQGGLVGPDLTYVAAQLPPDEILAAVLQPSARIHPNYQTKQIQLVDGTRVEGRYRGETAAEIQIANNDATDWDTYSKADIDRMRDGRKSLMPHDYGTRLTREQQDQIVAFLETLK